MIRKIKNAYKKIIPSEKYATKSFSQEGEDLVVKRFFDGQSKGFYIDVGCHHPFRFSNTFLFYKMGWKGICIDPLPGVKKKFQRWRPKDKVIEMGVSISPKNLTYYMFNEPALNTFDSELANSRDGEGGYRIVNQINVQTRSLAEIIEKNMSPDITQIDLLSVDAEGLDYDVLKSNDWKKFKPKMIIAECLNSDLKLIYKEDVTCFLETLNYKIYGKTGHSLIYLLEEK